MMQQRFFKLDTILRYAPLGLRFLDLARGVSVNDGLVVTARPIGSESPRQQAVRSPLSGIYGFRTLPRLGPFETSKKPASAWCGDTSSTDAGEPTAEDLTGAQKLHDLLNADEGPVIQANFVISVEDRMGRFLPLTLQMCLPREHLVEVPLFSSPARSALSGTGTIRGEVVLNNSSPALPATWALVIVTLDGKKYAGVTDARGMFTLFVPYASALPSLSGSPPRGNTGFNQLTWSLTIEVFYNSKMPGPAFAPPDILSIMEQASAPIHDVVGVAPVSAITRSIRFGGDLEVKTLLPEQSQLQKPSQLFIDPGS